MSVNDKVKVIWKTTCQWRDHAHWPKRPDIKLPGSGTGTLDPLTRGDAGGTMRRWLRVGSRSRRKVSIFVFAVF